jgi:hypothetical protein
MSVPASALGVITPTLDDMSLAAKKRLCLIIVIAGMANFMVFYVIALLIGGDAVNRRQSEWRSD